jgi:hypothetical protein
VLGQVLISRLTGHVDLGRFLSGFGVNRPSGLFEVDHPVRREIRMTGDTQPLSYFRVSSPAPTCATSLYLPLPDFSKDRNNPPCDSPNGFALISPVLTDAFTCA